MGAMQDSFPHALELSKRGYNAFALIYRPGAQTACEDLARAISFIFEHADELEVDTDCYSLWGGSAGARMAAWLGSYGPAAFGGDDLPQPGAIIMQYTGHSDYTENDPPTFACVGERDSIANWHTMQRPPGCHEHFRYFHGVSPLSRAYPTVLAWGPARWQRAGWTKRLLFGKHKCRQPIDIYQILERKHCYEQLYFSKRYESLLRQRLRERISGPA